jgi:FtsZ-binding cell division protein ZapB
MAQYHLQIQLEPSSLSDSALNNKIIKEIQQSFQPYPKEIIEADNTAEALEQVADKLYRALDNYPDHLSSLLVRLRLSD